MKGLQKVKKGFTKTLPIKCCCRCGASLKEVRFFGITCKDSYKRHKYKIYNIPL